MRVPTIQDLAEDLSIDLALYRAYLMHPNDAWKKEYEWLYDSLLISLARRIGVSIEVAKEEFNKTI